MRAQRATERDRDAGRRDPAGIDRAGVRGADLDPDRDLGRAAVDRAGQAAERLAEHQVRAAVQDADGLRVALDRHPGERAGRGDLEQLDPHPGDERAALRRREALQQRGVDVVGELDHGALRLVGDRRPSASARPGLAQGK